jgi:hypothetical protein
MALPFCQQDFRLRFPTLLDTRALSELIESGIWIPLTVGL